LWTTLARRAPSTLALGSYGTMHVPMENLSQNASVKMTHVLHRRWPAVVALGGRSTRCRLRTTVLQQVKAAVAVLAHWGNSGGGAPLPGVPIRTMPYTTPSTRSGQACLWLQPPGASYRPAVVRGAAGSRRGAAQDLGKVKDIILNAGSPALYQTLNLKSTCSKTPPACRRWSNYRQAGLVASFYPMARLLASGAARSSHGLIATVPCRRMRRVTRNKPVKIIKVLAAGGPAD
jgi:hypothetical protein